MNIDFYKKRAKKMLKEIYAGEPISSRRWNEYYGVTQFREPFLTGCQQIIAADCGYKNWDELLVACDESKGDG